MKLALIFVFCLLYVTTPLLAGQRLSPHADKISQEIKSLSLSEIEVLLQGKGDGMARAAEFNHYPGAKHVLELSLELELKEHQGRAVQDIYDEMKRNAIEIGGLIFNKEKELDAAFAAQTISFDVIQALTRNISILRGELRAVHLTSHLAVKALLSKQQIARYDEIRGHAQQHLHSHNHRALDRK